MTCIVGVTDGEDVWIGGDSFAGSVYDANVTAGPKLFRIGEMLIGYSGSFRYAQVIEHAASPPPRHEGESDAAYLFRYADVVRNALGEHGAKPNASGEGAGGDDVSRGDAIIGYRGGLYYLATDYAVIPRRDCWATGAGYKEAFGALHATRGEKPKKRIKAALEAAAAHNPLVRGPFHVERLRVKQG